MKNFFRNFFLPLKVRILIIIIFPVIFYPFIILYFNKYQEILINSEFLAMERQGTTFAKAIGMAEDQYVLIEKKKNLRCSTSNFTYIWRSKFST